MEFVSAMIVMFIMLFVYVNNKENKFTSRIVKYVNILFITALIVVSVLTAMIMSGFNEDTHSEDVCKVIVLGSGIEGMEVTDSLALRLDKGLEIASRYDTEIIVSGGHGSDESISEAKAMESYLIQKGFSITRIRMEEESTSTYQNIKFSKDLLGGCNNVVIVTSDYHAFRAKMIARDLDLEVSTAPSKTNRLKLVFKLYRENVALLKDIIFGVFR
jgi:uncharacterized SAM-binding protein YcdF (DUF218 family)